MARGNSLTLLDKGEIPERYRRNIGTIGIDGQKRLLEARVAVVGAGGLGGTIIELLARQGVGFLRIIDGDSFELVNLNRQLLATERTMGVNKAVSAAARVAEINSEVETDAVPAMFNEDNATELLSEMNVIVDALDTINCRLLLCRMAQKLKIPLVHAAIAGFTGQVGTILPTGPGLEKLYKTTSKGIETVLGNPAATPALAAAIQAQEVVKLLTGMGETLSHKLLYFDTELNIYELLNLG
ncbi:MAG TPA: HesA/MoeB/ThiF family protein [Nitrospirota bacterium]|nr:HesA/MoeB/ThiF family protein [Nitrospirota bacterium]